MRLYDFSLYAQRRKELQAAREVAKVISHLEQPGAVIELKHRVNEWFILHKEVLKRAS